VRLHPPARACQPRRGTARHSAAQRNASLSRGVAGVHRRGSTPVRSVPGNQPFSAEKSPKPYGCRTRKHL